MKITKIETVKTRKPIPFPGTYREAWVQPDGSRDAYGVSYYKISTDEGITGFGPAMGDADAYVSRCLLDADPFHTEKFWHSAMRGIDLFSNRGTYGGIDIALWDIMGKAAGLPVYKMLGARGDRVKVYAATSRLCSPEEHVDQVGHILSLGFKAVKMRCHRPDWREDIKAVEAVRSAYPDVTILVDGNQNNRSSQYRFWSRETAFAICRAMQDLGVFFFEEPLCKADYDGLAALSQHFDMYIAGGEHSPSIYDFKQHLTQGAYDILQPDPILGDIGITGLRKLGCISEFYGKMMTPHVCGAGNFGLSFPAAAAVVAGLNNCPVLEFPYDPPFLTEESQQFFLKNKFRVDGDGYVSLPDIPGIGVEIDEGALREYM